MKLSVSVLVLVLTVSAGNPPSSARQLQEASEASCNVTIPNRIVAGSPDDPHKAMSYGNALLSVWVWTSGTVVFKPGGPGFVTRDGALGMKFPWMRGGRGRLRVTGHRLDGEAPTLRSAINDRYGDVGFQPSYLIFPTPGCWEVQAQVGDLTDSKLVFVTRVVKIGDGPSWRRES
jgi:hypothetical protein